MRFVGLWLCALSLSPSAWGQSDAAYYGLALGSFEYDEEDFGGTPLFRDTTDSYRLMVAYQFSEHLMVEGGWGKTGTLRDTNEVDTIFGPVTVDFQSELKVLMVRLLGVLPFDSGLKLLGGMGYADIDQDFTYDLLGVGVQTGDVNGGEPTYYAGIQYDWDRFALRLAYEKYDTFDDVSDIAETSISFFYKL